MNVRIVILLAVFSALCAVLSGCSSRSESNIRFVGLTTYRAGETLYTVAITEGGDVYIASGYPAQLVWNHAGNIVAGAGGGAGQNSGTQHP